MADPDSEGEFESAESDSENIDKNLEGKNVHSSAVKSKETKNSEDKGDLDTEENETKEATEITEHDKDVSNVSPNESIDKPNSKETSIDENTDEDITVISTNVESTKENITDSESETPHESESITSQPVESQSIQQQTETEPQTGSGWGWGGWGGIGNLLSTSVAAVSDSAQAIGKGIGSVVTNVESTLGVPQPQEMIRDEQKVEEDFEKKEEKDDQHDESQEVEEKQTTPTALFGGFLSGFATAVQTTGIGIMSGGLDALEAIGRKTVDIISEGDPGLRKKRAFLSGGSLSQLLREAKEEAEMIQEKADLDGTGDVDIPLNYSILFDQYGGLVHLEALELLSKECSSKLRATLSSYIGEELEKMQENIDSVNQYFKTDEEETGEKEEGEMEMLVEVQDILGELGKKIKIEKLLKASEQARSKIASLKETLEDVTEVKKITIGNDKEEEDKETKDEGETEIKEEIKEKETKESAGNPVKVYYETGLHVLAEISSLSVELLRKAAEVSLLPNIEMMNCNELAEKLQRVTLLICNDLDSIISLLTDLLTKQNFEEADSTITSLYFETSNSCSYIQDAFQLLLPIIQLKIVQTSPSSSSDDINTDCLEKDASIEKSE